MLGKLYASQEYLSPLCNYAEGPVSLIEVISKLVRIVSQAEIIKEVYDETSLS